MKTPHTAGPGQNALVAFHLNRAALPMLAGTGADLVTTALQKDRERIVALCSIELGALNPLFIRAIMLGWSAGEYAVQLQAQKANALKAAAQRTGLAKTER